MATLVHYKDPNSEALAELIKNLEPTPGTCIFIDIVNSTADKYKITPVQWIRKLNNTFNFISLLNNFPNFVVKGIGDEMMLFLTDKDLLSNPNFQNHYMLLEEICATINNLKDHPRKELFYECKVGIHYCTDVFNITFFEGVNDYYGTDIDLSARIMKKAEQNNVVISNTFYKKVLENVQSMGINPTFSVLANISEPIVEQFKGVPYPVEYRMINL